MKRHPNFDSWQALDDYVLAQAMKIVGKEKGNGDSGSTVGKEAANPHG